MCYVKSQQPPIPSNSSLDAAFAKDVEPATFSQKDEAAILSMNDLSWLSGFSSFPPVDSSFDASLAAQAQSFDFDDDCQLIPWLTETMNTSTFLPITPPQQQQQQLSPPYFPIEQVLTKLEPQQTPQIFSCPSINTPTASPNISPLSSDNSEPSFTQSPGIQSKKRCASSKVEDPNVLVKRLKNTEAARHSRARKTAKLETLQQGTRVIQQENANMKMKLLVLENEHMNCAAREKALTERIMKLEMQLVESHRAMLQLIQSK